MYEERQNKEKISRRIDAAGSRAGQRVKMEDKVLMMQPLSKNILQLNVAEATTYWIQHNWGNLNGNSVTRVMVVQNGNAGLIRAWNRGLIHINQDYIFMNQDQWDGSRIAPQYNRRNRNIRISGDYASEYYLSTLNQRGNTPVNPHIAIIGNDEDIKTQLENHYNNNQRQPYPNCLSIYLRNNGISDWTQEANDAFLHSLLTTHPNVYIVTQYFVNCANQMIQNINNGAQNVNQITQNLNQNASTIREIAFLLLNGYTLLQNNVLS